MRSSPLTFIKGATSVLMSGKKIAKTLLKARTTKDFFKFAIKNGVTYKRSSSGGSHIQLKSRNGVRMTLASVDNKKDLQNSAIKVNIQVFEKMGIAYEKN